MIPDFFSRELAQLGKDAIGTLDSKDEKVATVTKCCSGPKDTRCNGLLEVRGHEKRFDLRMSEGFVSRTGLTDDKIGRSDNGAREIQEKSRQPDAATVVQAALRR